MIAAPKPKVAKKIETIEALKVRLRNRWSGMIGSLARGLDQDEDDQEDQRRATIMPQTHGSVQVDVSATVRPMRIGMRPQREGDHAEVVDAGVSRLRPLMFGSSRAITTSATRPIGRLTKKIQCQLKLVGEEAAERRADEERDAEDGAEEALVLAAFGGREQVADDGERDREQGAGAEALDAAEEDRAATSSG